MTRAEKAEMEAQAQLDIVRALKPLTERRQSRVIMAISYILAAEELVPGVLDLICAKEDRDAQ